MCIIFEMFVASSTFACGWAPLRRLLPEIHGIYTFYLLNFKFYLLELLYLNVWVFFLTGGCNRTNYDVLWIFDSSLLPCHQGFIMKLHIIFSRTRLPRLQLIQPTRRRTYGWAFKCGKRFARPTSSSTIHTTALSYQGTEKM